MELAGADRCVAILCREQHAGRADAESGGRDGRVEPRRRHVAGGPRDGAPARQAGPHGLAASAASCCSPTAATARARRFPDRPGVPAVPAPRPRGHDLRDIVRRLKRRTVAGARVHARFYDAETIVETDEDGYFRVQPEARGAAAGRPALASAACCASRGRSRRRPRAEIYIPPRAGALRGDLRHRRHGDADRCRQQGEDALAAVRARMPTSGRDFPGVAALYRGLHRGVSGDEGNPMLYVSRAPWGIYDILDSFFRARDIPVGPILFLREWGVSWKRPVPRRAEDHKRVLIEAMMALYRDMPFVLIGDSGQHDPEVYRHAVERYPGPGDRRSTSATCRRTITSGRPRSTRSPRRWSPPGRGWCSPPTASPSPSMPPASG